MGTRGLAQWDMGLTHYSYCYHWLEATFAIFFGMPTLSSVFIIAENHDICISPIQVLVRTECPLRQVLAAHEG